MSNASTKPSTRRLSEVARHLVYPDGIVSSGWPTVRARLSDMGIRFDGWQEGAASLILGRDPGGRYTATVGGVTMSIPRQVGKTFTVGSLLIAMCIEHPGLRVVWTSHHLRTTTNTFRAMQGMVRRKRIAGHLAPNGIRVANGEQEIRFGNGSIIMFGARDQGFGVGIDAIDIMVCDEAQRLSSRALADMVPTTNQSRHAHGALLFFIGTPPRPDNAGDEFARRRRKAIDGQMTHGVYIEMSADKGADPDDPLQWGKANPSYPHRTPHEAMLRLRENLTDPGDWRREALGIWDDDITGVTRLIPADAWSSVLTTTPPPEGVRSLGMVFDFESDRGALVGAMKHDGGVHLELIASGPVNIEALAEWLAARWRTVGMIALAGGANAKVLKQALRDRKVPERVIWILTTPEYFAGNAMLLSSIVTTKTVTIPAGDPADALEQSVKVSDRKHLPGGSGWRWISTSPDGDQRPMEALSVALWAARTNRRTPGRTVKAR